MQKRYILPVRLLGTFNKGTQVQRKRVLIGVLVIQHFLGWEKQNNVNL